MTLPTSGPISLDMIRQELGITGSFSLGSAEARSLAGIPTGQIKLSDFYGKSVFGLLHTLANPNAYDTSAYDNFGYAVSVSDSYVAVGAYAEDDAGGFTSGKVYVFSLATGGLMYVKDNPNSFGTSANDNFGGAVAISDNYLIVGAHVEGSAAGDQSGVVYVFNASDGGFVRTINDVNAYDTATGDYFGYAVDIEGSVAIIGAYAEDDVGGTTSGKAYLMNVATGALIATIDNPNAYGTTAGDYFGQAVSMSSSYLLIGAWLEDDAGGTSSGKAYLFNASNGTFIRTFNNPNVYGTSASDFFGYKVDVSDQYAVVGAYAEDSATGNSSGAVYVFDVTTGALVRTFVNPNAFDTDGGDNFGFAVTVSGDTVIVGAYNEGDAGGISSGKVYMFSVSTGQLIRTIDNPNAFGDSASDRFGYRVNARGNTLVVGAYGEEDVGGEQSGKAYVYKI